nr:unnamed protein product [Digitaria exilis]
MRLVVRVIEARGLPAAEADGPRDPYAKAQLGKQRAKTKVLRKTLCPAWDEEFAFRVGDLRDQLIVSVLDEDRYFSDDVLGQVKVPLTDVLDADNRSLGTQWYQLQPKSKKAKLKDCGEIQLCIYLAQNYSEGTTTLAHWASDDLASNSDKSAELVKGSSLPNIPIEISTAASESDDIEVSKENKSNGGPSFVNKLYQMFKPKDAEAPAASLSNLDSSSTILEETPSTSSQSPDKQDEEVSATMTFEELLKAFGSQDEGKEMPENLSGGVLLDQVYAVAQSDLNTFLFSPSSDFLQSLAEIQGTTGLEIQQWRLENDGEILKRVVSYTKAPTKLVKAVKATEDMTYLKADGEMFAVLADVSTPDVPFGSNFRVEILTCIMPAPELPDDEKSSRLVVSWRLNFLQSTMMKGMIENGARQGLKDNYAQFSDLLARTFRPVDAKDTADNNELLSSVQPEQESDWKLAFRIFGNFALLSSVFAFLYVSVHIILARPSIIQGLEFPGLDLPDSAGEVVVCGVLVLQGQRVLNMIGRFIQAKRQREIFEFDAMEDPPSVMEINVYDFDGPFDEVASLGHAEVNFLKYNISELADIWIPLKGKLAQACQSKLHLRIFLNNTKGTEIVKDYLDKMEKEVGKKIAVRTIMALWKTRSLTPEQNVQLVEEESETEDFQNEEGGSFLGTEDAKMSEVFSCTKPFDVSTLMNIFDGGPLEHQVMEKVGCVDYSVTEWEPVRDDVYQRQVHHKFDNKSTRHGGQAMSTQQKSPLPSKNGWLVEEVMTLEGIPVGECFNVRDNS